MREYGLGGGAQTFDERTNAKALAMTVCHCSVKIFISSLLWVKSAIRAGHLSLFPSVH